MAETNNTKIQGVEQKARVFDVLKVYWQAMAGSRGAYLFMMVSVVVTGIMQVLIPTLYKRFFDILTTASNRQTAANTMVSLIVEILVLNIIIWLIYRGAIVAQNIHQAKVMARLKQQSFNYLIGHSYGFFANNFTGSLTQRVNRLARSLDVFADRIIWNIIPLTITVTGSVIILWRVNPVISWIIIGLVAVLFIFNYFFSIWKVKYDIQAAALDSKTTGVLSDNITNHNTVQLFNGNDAEIGNYKQVTNDQAKLTSFTWNISAIVDAVQSGSMIFIEFLLFFISVKYWRAGLITVGTFVLIQSYLVGLGARLWDLSRIIRNLYESFADAKEMTDILLTPHEIKDLPTAEPLKVTAGVIELKNVSFSFNQTRTVLDQVSLTINAQEKVALIGPSGAGKSTFVRLILRLYDTASGCILIDGQNIKYATQGSLREAISFVPQEPILFHRTLMENIRYGRPDATDEEVKQAARLAHCAEFIEALPLQYETYVGERGIKLSGGERQRVAIARAILKNAPILILDEATSSLDSESEHLIQDALDTLMKNKTVIVIAHRLSTISKMDRIVVMENGTIREQGSHDELLQKSQSLYRKLWNLQAGGFIIDQDQEIKTT